MTPSRATLVPALALAVGLVTAGAVSAQGGGAPSGGPMTVEQIRGGFLVAPEVKFTSVDHHASTLVGGHAGWVADEHFFIGGAGYWLANDAANRRLSYGGLDVGVVGQTSERVGWSLTALFGGGRATLRDDVTFVTYAQNPAAFDRHGFPVLVPNGTTVVPVRVRQDFFVFEPRAEASFRLSRHVRLVGGIGYRAVNADRHDDGRLSAAVGSIALQIGSAR